MKPPEILQLKLTLNGSQPNVWRRILIPADYTFFDLHCAIQSAMGWTDSHLHAFRFTDKKRLRDSINIATPMPEDDRYRDRITDERLTRVKDYLGVVSKQCVYDYDFGDSWEHTILLEKILPKVKGVKYPQCVAGKNACPPDDCGGIWGYAELIKTVKNPKHPEHADMLEWLCIDSPEDFDPTEFDPAKVDFEDPKKRIVEWNKGFGPPVVSKKKKNI